MVCAVSAKLWISTHASGVMQYILTSRPPDPQTSRPPDIHASTPDVLLASILNI